MFLCHLRLELGEDSREGSEYFACSVLELNRYLKVADMSRDVGYKMVPNIIIDSLQLGRGEIRPEKTEQLEWQFDESLAHALVAVEVIVCLIAIAVLTCGSKVYWSLCRCPFEDSLETALQADAFPNGARCTKAPPYTRELRILARNEITTVWRHCNTEVASLGLLLGAAAQGQLLQAAAVRQYFGAVFKRG